MKKIVVMTPTKNEDWIIDKFLNMTSKFADYIIILDQNSNDKTREIVQKFDKTILIENKSDSFNEKERQEILLRKAREISPDSVLIALDADEIFSPNFYEDVYLNSIRNLSPGTTISFDWANLHWDHQHYWRSRMQPILFVDDGRENLDPSLMHRTRVPRGPKKLNQVERDIKVLHFQYTDLLRLKTKHVWYQLHEVLYNNIRDFVYLYRKYHHMFGIKNKDLHKIPLSWITFYRENQTDIFDFKEIAVDKLWWNSEIGIMSEKLPKRILNKIDFDFSLSEKSQLQHKSLIDEILFTYLEKTQKYYNPKINHLLTSILIRVLDKLLGRIW